MAQKMQISDVLADKYKNLKKHESFLKGLFNFLEILAKEVYGW